MTEFTMQEIDFAIDWFNAALERDKDHDQDLCLDCKANRIALSLLMDIRDIHEEM